MSELVNHAKREFLALGYTPLDQAQEEGPDKWIQEGLLELLEVFSNQGHSGFSGSYCIEMFYKLVKFEPLSPLVGAEDEWLDVSEYSPNPCWQNKRCPHVFKDADGQAYDIQGRVFRQPDGVCFTSDGSRTFITFPYTPRTVYVDVTDEDGEEKLQ